MAEREIFLQLKKFFRIQRDNIIGIADMVLFYVSLISFFVVIFDVGFSHSEYTARLLERYYVLVLDFFIVVAPFRFVLKLAKEFKFYSFAAELLIILFTVSVAGAMYLFPGWLEKHLPFLLYAKHKPFVYALFLLLFFSELGKQSLKFHQLNIHPALLFILSFLFLIFVGTALLLLPNATISGISVMDALFTSTSAVCVTGLIVVDTGTCFTMLGKTIILSLIQAGGLGIMTFTSFFGFFFSGKSSFRDQLFLKDFMNTEKMGEVFGTISRIVFITILIEALGALFIFLLLPENVFSTDYDKIKFSVFHSVSAFCNAGFSTLQEGLYNIHFRFQYSLHWIIATLIILGGLGFPIVFNYYSFVKHYVKTFLRTVFSGRKFKFAPRLININTKLVINTTFLLLVAGMLLILLFEFQEAFIGMNFWGKITTSFFCAVTSRTAGFNTIDFAGLTHASIFLVIFLMWVGASPGSTGGGIKTTTLAVAMLNAVSLAKGKDRVEVFKREISHLSIRRAHAMLFLSLLLIGTCFFLLSVFEPEKNFVPLLFETVSAFSTTGLSLGITSELSDAGKGVLIFTMFIGRVGTLTMMVAFIRKAKTLHYRYPSESIFIN